MAAAFTFLTRLPLGRLAAHDPADLPASAFYFPVVGVVVGLIGATVYTLAARLWSAPLALLLSMCATVLVTGAFHEDALADAFDGFGGGWTRDQVLAIMKDSRVGSYALVGVALTLAVKFAALLALTERGPAEIARVLVCGHAIGRWSSLLLIRRYPYVRPTADGERASAGRPFVAGVSTRVLIAATILTGAIAGSALGMRSIAAAAVAVAVTLAAGWYFARRIGGITGDALGAANQIVEVCVYLTLAAHLR